MIVSCDQSIRHKLEFGNLSQFMFRKFVEKLSKVEVKVLKV